MLCSHAMLMAQAIYNLPGGARIREISHELLEKQQRCRDWAFSSEDVCRLCVFKICIVLSPLT